MNESPFLALIENAALLLAAAALFDIISVRRQGGKDWFRQAALGILVGGIGITLMLTHWVYQPGINFDTRSVLLGISGLFFGMVPTLMAMAITAGYRLYQGGAGAWTGVLVILSAGTIGILWRHFRRKPPETIPDGQLYLFGLVIHVVMLACMFTLPFATAKQILAVAGLPILIIYPLGTLLIGLVIANRLRRERKANDLYRTEARLRSLVDILQKPVASMQDFVSFALEQAIALTESKIGYIFFYSEERQEFTTDLVSQLARAQSKVMDVPSTYLLSETGLWGEPVRQRKALLINDFSAPTPLKKGFPLGHVEIVNYLTIPVFSGRQIVAVVGVANKDTDYDEADVLQLTLLMDGIWQATERKQAEEALRASEEQLRIIFDRSTVGYTQTAVDGVYLKVNLSFAAMLGYTVDELVGRNWMDITHPEDRIANQAILDPILGGERKSAMMEKRYLHKDGSTVSVLVSTTLLRDTNGAPLFYITNILDISGRKLAEEKLVAAQAELQRMFVEADQSRRALLSLTEDQKRVEGKIRLLNLELEQRIQERTAQLQTANIELEAFAYSVSHDLRAPLRALDGYSGALLADYADHLDGEGRHYLARIQEASHKMAQLIEDLLNLSRVTRREMNLEQVDLSSLAQGVAAELQAQNPERRVEFDIASGLVGWADRNLIGIALENLLSNAFKFSNGRELACIKVGMLDSPGERTFFVRDNGVGFNLAYADKLFIPFQRLHSVNEFPGTGIGLVTVQRIISRHGGRIWPEAMVDQGATFYFTLGGSQ